MCGAGPPEIGVPYLASGDQALTDHLPDDLRHFEVTGIVCRVLDFGGDHEIFTQSKTDSLVFIVFLVLAGGVIGITQHPLVLPELVAHHKIHDADSGVGVDGHAIAVADSQPVHGRLQDHLGLGVTGLAIHHLTFWERQVNFLKPTIQSYSLAKIPALFRRHGTYFSFQLPAALLQFFLFFIKAPHLLFVAAGDLGLVGPLFSGLFWILAVIVAIFAADAVGHGGGQSIQNGSIFFYGYHKIPPLGYLL